MSLGVLAGQGKGASVAKSLDRMASESHGSQEKVVQGAQFIIRGNSHLVPFFLRHQTLLHCSIGSGAMR